MAELSIRKATTPWSNDWEPLRRMRDLLQWDPFREMTALPSVDAPEVYSPAFEVKETKDGYIFRADMPGIKENDLDVQLTGDRLTISGKREAEEQQKGETYYAYERTFGAFTRSFTLPDGASSEGTHAELKDGVFTLILPKKPEAKSQKIPIGSAKGVKA